MSDTEIIEAIARLWVEMGGDEEGLAWCYSDLKEAVRRLSNSEVSHE